MLHHRESVRREPKARLLIPSLKISRQIALQILYACDIKSDWSAGNVFLSFENFFEQTVSDLAAGQGYLHHCLALIEGVSGAGEDLDTLIVKISKSAKKPENLGVAHRNILRLVLYEFLFMKPGSLKSEKSAKSAALALAKAFCENKQIRQISVFFDKKFIIPGRKNSKSGDWF